MKTALSHQIRHLPVAQREPQVPTHTDEDDWAFVMPPEEGIGRPYGHRFCPTAVPFGFLATQPVEAVERQNREPCAGHAEPRG
jgi:hypothetical protein